MGSSNLKICGLLSLSQLPNVISLSGVNIPHNKRVKNPQDLNHFAAKRCSTSSHTTWLTGLTINLHRSSKQVTTLTFFPSPMKTLKKSFTYRQQPFGANMSPFLFILKSSKFADFVRDNISNTHLTIFQLLCFLFFKRRLRNCATTLIDFSLTINTLLPN